MHSFATFYIEIKKNQSLSKLALLAGALGLEPRTNVLETNYQYIPFGDILL